MDVVTVSSVDADNYRNRRRIVASIYLSLILHSSANLLLRKRCLIMRDSQYTIATLTVRIEILS